MKKYLLLLFVLFSSMVNAQETFVYKWDIGGSFGVGGATKGEIGFMSQFELGFNRRVPESRWRWGVAAGIRNPGTAAYWTDEESSELQYYSYAYLLGSADYAIRSFNDISLFAHGGIAPCLESDIYGYESGLSEYNFSGFAQLGVGIELLGIIRMTLTGYKALNNDSGLLFSLGLYFGKR